MQTLDGDAAGGVLGAIISFETTSVEGVCAGCGRRQALGAVAAYKTGMGTILRCSSCEIEGHYRLDMRGVRMLRL